MDLQDLANLNIEIAIAAYEAETRNKRLLVESIINYAAVLNTENTEKKSMLSKEYLMNLHPMDLLNQSRKILSEVKRKDKKGYFKEGITEFEQNINVFTRIVSHSKPS